MPSLPSPSLLGPHYQLKGVQALEGHWTGLPAEVGRPLRVHQQNTGIRTHPATGTVDPTNSYVLYVPIHGVCTHTHTHTHTFLPSFHSVCTPKYLMRGRVIQAKKKTIIEGNIQLLVGLVPQKRLWLARPWRLKVLWQCAH